MHRIDWSKNIMRDLTTNTEVELLTSDDVSNKFYGVDGSNLEIEYLHICNTAAAVNCTISLYLKRRVPLVNPKIAIEDAFDPKIHIFEPDQSLSDNVYVYHYFCKTLAIPVGTAVQFEKEVFGGIDFLYHELCIIGDSNSEGTVTLNIKHL